MTNLLRLSLLACALAAIPSPARADDDGDDDGDVAAVSDAPDGLAAVSRGVQLPGGML